MKKYLFYLFSVILLTVMYSCDKNVEKEIRQEKISLLSNGEVCGTPNLTKAELHARAQARRSANYISVDPNQPICINVFFHIVRNSNSTGGYPAANLGIIIDSLNRNYNRHGIYFNSAGHDFINNTAYTAIDNETEATQLAGVNVKSNAIDYYIVNSLWSVGDGAVVGTALDIPSKRLIIRSDRVTTSTSSHEMGHCLDLLHTHQGTETGSAGCAENINGSNCSTCGDEICDTPADDGEGTTNGYSPDMNNIMSYYLFRHRFTDMQASRMKVAIANTSFLGNVVGQNCIIPKLSATKETYCKSENITYNIQNGGSSVNWVVSDNADIISQNTTSITIKPKTIYERSVFVEAVLPFQTIRKEIWVGSPLVALNMYCDDVFSTTCDLNSGGASGSLPWGTELTWSMTGRGLGSTGNSDMEWEKVFGNFTFTTGSSNTSNPVNNGEKSLGQTATLQITGSGTIQFRIRAKNSCGWGDWKYVLYSVTM